MWYLWVPIFSIMCHAFLPLRSPTLCHTFRVPGGVRHPSFVVIRQRVRAPGRSPCIIIRQRVREPGRSRIDHPTFTSGHRLVPPHLPRQQHNKYFCSCVTTLLDSESSFLFQLSTLGKCLLMIDDLSHGNKKQSR